jgi:purine-binding chemotaxis protein CheW
MRESSDDNLFLFCRVGNRACALQLGSVVETMRPLPIETVADVPSFVRGVAIIRGAPVPVVDAAALVGSESAGAAGRFVTVRAAGRVVALEVSSVSGIGRLSAEALTDLPPLFGARDPELLEAVAVVDRELVMALALARVVPPSAWESIARAKEAS